MLGRPGFGISHVAANALELGRYSVAWGSVGLAQACLDASEAHAAGREAFGERLDDHQLVRAMVQIFIDKGLFTRDELVQAAVTRSA